MTVTSVLLNFRNALLVLLPMVERVDIPWRRGDAYDEWDAITSVLFNKLVQEVLRWHLSEDNQADFDLPEYDLLLSTYAGLATLEVVHPSLQPGRWVFHAFGTDNESFDVVEVRSLSVDGWPTSDELKTCPIDGAIFLLRMQSGHVLSEELNYSY